MSCLWERVQDIVSRIPAEKETERERSRMRVCEVSDIIFSKNAAGKECVFDNCGDCRECGNNPNRIACGCQNDGFYTTRPERIKRYREAMD